MVQCVIKQTEYRTRAIISRGLYIFFTPFQKTIYVLWPLALCMACIQERLLIKSGLWWRAYGSNRSARGHAPSRFFKYRKEIIKMLVMALQILEPSTTSDRNMNN